MGFNMRDNKKQSGGNGPRLIMPQVEGSYVPAGAHPAKFCMYVEVGEHDMSNKFNPNKGVKPKCFVGFEFPTFEYEFKKDAGAQPLWISNGMQLSAYELAQAYKYFTGLSNCLVEEELRKVPAGSPPEAFKAVPTYNSINVDSFDQMLGCSCVVTVTNKKGKRTYKDAYPNGTTIEMIKAAKEKNETIATVPVQQVDHIYANVRPEGVASTYNPMFGAQAVDFHANSVGVVRFLWDAPTVEDYNSVPKYMQKIIKEAVNYPGSDVEAVVLQAEAEEKKAKTPTTEPGGEAKGVDFSKRLKQPPKGKDDLGPAFPSEASGMDDVPF